jgi:hypothetical protein
MIYGLHERKVLEGALLPVACAGPEYQGAVCSLFEKYEEI